MKFNPFVAIVPFLFLSSCQAQTSPTVGNDAFITDTLPFSCDTNFMSRHFNDILCSVEINGHILDNVLIDNGCRYSVISPDFAPKLGLQSIPFDTSLWTLHERKRGYSNGFIVKDLVCKISKTTYRLDTIEIDDVAQRMKRNKRIKFVLGKDFFEKYVVEFDFRKNVMIFSNRLPDKVSQYLAIPMEPCRGIHLTRLRCINVDGFKLKNGDPMQVRVMLDLGGSETAYGKDFLRRVDQHFSRLDTSSMAYLILNTIGTAVDSVDFRFFQEEKGIRKKNLPGFVSDLNDLNSEMILGVDFFRHFNVIFDYKNNMLYLKRNEE